MKKPFIISIAVLTLTVAHGQTNVYHQFPDTNAIWTVQDGQSYAGSCCPHAMWDRSYIQTGDTVINNIQYNKLYRNEHSYDYGIFPTCSCDHGITTNIFVGGLRNDIPNKKIYFYDANNNQECLLYDFNLNVGDTIRDWMTYCANGNIYWKVTSIDSVLIGTLYHKRFNINGGINADTSVIEGVGSLTGLLGPYLFFENQNQLVCFSVLGQVKYTNPNSFFACGVVSIAEIKNALSYSIFPNPFSGQTTLWTTNPLINATLTVDNCFGQTVVQIKNLSGQTITFNRDNLPSGLYFLRLTKENKIYTDKLIVVDK